jgi:hypothetical protein
MAGPPVLPNQVKSSKRVNGINMFYFCDLDCGPQLATRIDLSTLELLTFDL